MPDPTPLNISTSSPSKHLLTSILTSLSTVNPTKPPKTLNTLAPNEHKQARSVLLTLHFLFPHELLPALDIIDRQLISHLYTTAAEKDPVSFEAKTIPRPEIEVYYVRSATATSETSNVSHGRFRNALSKSGQFYEVRLDGWNCSCAAFALSGLRLSMKARTTGERQTAVLIGEGGVEQGTTECERVYEWVMGGTATKDDAVMPICKHILAVALSKAAPGLFGGGVVSREVEKEELAGWAAGWGEH